MKKYPLVVYLHGDGESGTDYRHLTTNSHMILDIVRNPEYENQGFVLAPQKPNSGQWNDIVVMDKSDRGGKAKQNSL